MKLSELSATTGVSTASIKFYLREGLLHPGHKKNATTAVYDESHCARLDLMSTAQALGAGALIPDGDAQVGESERALVRHLLDTRAWPDRDSEARRGVEKLLAQMAEDNYLPSTDYLEQLTRIIDELSALDLTVTVTPDAGDGPGALDSLALRVAVGTYRHSRLLVALL